MTTRSISDPTLELVDILTVGSLANYRIPCADMTGGTPGVAKVVTLFDLYQVLNYKRETRSNNWNSSHYWRPLNQNRTSFSENSEDSRMIGILVAAPDNMTVVYAPPGASIIAPTAMLQGGNGYNLSTSGRFVWWTSLGSIYLAEKPFHTHPNVTEILEIVAINTGNSTFEAVVL